MLTEKLPSCPFCGSDSVRAISGHSTMDGEVNIFTMFLCGLDDGTGGCGAVVSFRPSLKDEAAIRQYSRRAGDASDRHYLFD